MEGELNILVEAYKRWIATPEGKKRNEEVNARKLKAITNIPYGWSLEDGKPEDEYMIFVSDDNEKEITIELTMSGPIALGGKQSVRVTVKEEIETSDESGLDYDEDETVLFKESLESPQWESVIDRATEALLTFMKTH